jgi:hypothetical protein
MAVEKTTREKLECTVDALKAERRPFEPDWEEIARLASPRQINITSRSSNTKRASNRVLNDSGGILASRTTVNGMATGLTSSSSPWFKLAVRDRDMMEFGPVKEWLHIVEQVIYGFFSSTNYYDTTKMQYGDLVQQGVGATLMTEHRKYMGVNRPLVLGTYWLGLDDGLRVTTLAVRSNPTVKQLVEEVRDKTKISDAAMRAYDKGDYAVRVPVMQVVEPNEDAYGEMLSRNIAGKPWRSIKWEIGQNDKHILLSEKGFDSQPFTAPRWENYGDSAYCDSSPGFQALGELREVQLAAKRGGRAMDGIVKPPMAVPANLARTGISLDPGTFTYMEAMGTDQRPQPMVTINHQAIQAIYEKQDWLKQRLDQIYYSDLFMAISQMEGVQPRNEQELMFRQEEKLTQLGPVVDRVNIEKLEYDIDRAFTICKNLGLIPPAPPEMDGQPLTVDFISILARAQKAAENTIIERTARFVGFLASVFPESAVKFDADQAIDEFAQNSGTSPKIIRTDDVVAKMRAEIAQREQAERAAAMAAPAADAANAAKVLSETEVTPGRNALQNIMGL